MTPENQLAAPTTNATTPPETAAASLNAMLEQVAALRSEMLIHQQESDALGQHTEQNLAKIRALMGKS